MATGGVSARDGARPCLRSARPASGLRPHRLEALLDRRAEGHKVERIAYDLRIPAAQVREILNERRRAGDPRALTDQKAAAAAAARCELARAMAAAAAAPPPPPPPKRHRIDARPIDPARRGGFVSRLRDMAASFGATHPKAASGLAHLSDLYEHCPTTYPNLVFGVSGVLPPRFDAAPSVTAGGSPALACASA